MTNLYFKGEEVAIETGIYKSGRIALSLYTTEDGMPYCSATTDVKEYPILNESELLVKNYSENQGVLEFLVENNIVEDTGITYPAGYAKINICKLLPKENWGNKTKQNEKVNS